ncbi:unnamed protein product, partial [marine sediment metagenome]
RVALTNSLIPFVQSILELAIITGFPGGSGKTENLLISTPAPLINSACLY